MAEPTTTNLPSGCLAMSPIFGVHAAHRFEPELRPCRRWRRWDPAWRAGRGARANRGPAAAGDRDGADALPRMQALIVSCVFSWPRLELSRVQAQGWYRLAGERNPRPISSPIRFNLRTFRVDVVPGAGSGHRHRSPSPWPAPTMGPEAVAEFSSGEWIHIYLTVNFVFGSVKVRHHGRMMQKNHSHGDPRANDSEDPLLSGFRGDSPSGRFLDSAPRLPSR